MQENNINEQILWESEGTSSLEKSKDVDPNSLKKYFKMTRFIAIIIAIIISSLTITSSMPLYLILVVLLTVVLFLYIVMKVTDTKDIKTTFTNIDRDMIKMHSGPMDSLTPKSHYAITEHYLAIEDFVADKTVDLQIPFSYINEYEIIATVDKIGTLRIEAEFFPDRINEPDYTEVMDFFLQDVKEPQKAFKIIDQKFKIPEIAEARKYRQEQNRIKQEEYNIELMNQRKEFLKNPFSYPKDSDQQEDDVSYHSKLNDSQTQSKLN